MPPTRVVDGQPKASGNVFALAPSEQVHKTFVKESGGCGCGPTYTVTLTDARLLQRQQEYACCGQGARVDQMLFLSDISAISDSVSKRSCCPSCSLCCICACFCKDNAAVPVAIRGSFGEEVFVFGRNDLPSALAEIPAAAIRARTRTSTTSTSTSTWTCEKVLVLVLGLVKVHGASTSTHTCTCTCKKVLATQIGRKRSKASLDIII